MKKNLLFISLILFVGARLQAQVTQLNNNGSLRPQVPLSSTLTLLVSDIDKSIWVTDGTLAGTVQISSTIEYEEGTGFFVSGKYVFVGTTSATGTELYSTDGTSGGTGLLVDINSGAAGSRPSGFTVMNGILYFEATTVAEGRELWRSDGTSGGTSLVKDIVPGTDSSFNGNSSSFIFTAGSFLLFAANTAASGNELWISDGTNGGTNLLKEINTGNANADSSNPNSFFPFNGKILFTATDNTNGNEFWTTDGTTGGTTLLKDINPGTGSSVTFEFFPGFDTQVFSGFHEFNNKLFFTATDGTSIGELWSTDGTPGNTVLVKDIITGTAFGIFVLSTNAENLSGKFIFPATDGSTRFELWESDGTPTGTQLFKSFDPATPQIPVVLQSFSVVNGNLTYPLFKGTQFFFIAGTSAEGYELWITDGTPGGTQIVKDLNPGSADGIVSPSFMYTSDSLFFAGIDGTNGNELWRTDGTSGGTVIVKDINPGSNDANPEISFLTNNGKILFDANDGDNANAVDLFALNGTFTALPLRLTDFTVTLLEKKESLLKWSTEREINTKNFTVERSWEGQKFEPIGTVQAAGTSNLKHEYSFKDPGTAQSSSNKVYYRLLSTDLDGKSSYSKVIALSLKWDASWNVRLQSNPVQNNPTLILNGISGNLNLSIHDMSGKTVYRRTVQGLNGQLYVPVNLQSGVYILEAEYNNQRKVIRFVK